jgi:hypothetical protein
MVEVAEVRRLCLGLPRTTEHLVRGRVKFRVGRLVYVAFSRDETQMGFGFPKELREVMVEGEPEKFLMPRASDLRYNWLEARLDALGGEEMAELVTDAWVMCVPRYVAREYLDRQCGPGGPTIGGEAVSHPRRPREAPD